MSPSSFAFYDGRADIGLPELDRMVQGLLWLGDTVLVPSYIRPSPFAADEERQVVANQLQLLAEAGYLRRWDVETLPDRIGLAPWWPGSTTASTLTSELYEAIQDRVSEGVARQKADLARGFGRAPGSILSGVAEIVTLRETLWTLGVARAFGADLLVSSAVRSQGLIAPLKLLKHADLVHGPITQTLLEFASVSDLALLSPKDIGRLRKKSEPFRSFVDAVARETETEQPFVDQDELLELVREATAKRYGELVGATVQGSQSSARNSAVGGTALTVAGMAFPPLSVAGFAAPLLSWNPRDRDSRKMLLFLSKLQKVTARSARERL